MYKGKTLVVVLSMHRSGSSLTTDILQRLGMSLGPFELIGPAESNKYGHFEAFPIYELDNELLERTSGFPDDVPRCAKLLRQFCKCEGRWNLQEPIPERMFSRGEQLIQALIESGPVSGFKDPRIPLLWPFWSRVLSSFPGLRVVPIVVVRSPHEVAMSIFSRSRGMLAYRDALDMTAVHFKRMHEIRETWKGDHALVRFDRCRFSKDLRGAAETCGLEWRNEVFADAYDSTCKHHHENVIAHHAQTRFHRLAETPCGTDSITVEQLAWFERDAALRDGVLRDQIGRSNDEIEQLAKQLAQSLTEADRVRQKAEQLAGQLTQSRQENEQARQQAEQLAGQLTQSRQENEQARQQAEQLAGQLMQSRQENEQARQQAGQLAGQLTQSRQENEQARQQAEQLAGQLMQFRQENGQARQKAGQLAEQLTQSRQEIEQAMQEAEQLAGQLAQSRQDNEQAKQESEQLAGQLAQFRQENERVRQEAEQLAGQLAQSRQKNEQAKQEGQQLRADLALITESRTWRLRACAMSVMGLL